MMDKARSAKNLQPLADDLLWGARPIAVEIGVTVRKAFYLAERGLIPVRKVGAQLVASRRELRRHLSGETAA